MAHGCTFGDGRDGRRRTRTRTFDDGLEDEDEDGDGDEDGDLDETRRDERHARLDYDVGQATTETSVLLASDSVGDPDARHARLIDDLGQDDTRDEHRARLDQWQGDDVGLGSPSSRSRQRTTLVDGRVAQWPTIHHR